MWFLLRFPTKTILLTIIWYPSMTLYKVLNPALVVSAGLMLLYLKERRKIGKIIDFPFWIPFLVCLSSYVISFTVWSSSYASVYSSIFIYLLPLFFWIYYKGNAQWHKFYMKHLILYLFILSIVGIIESICNINIFYDIAKSLDPEIPDKGFNIRFGLKQAQSITIWCECYGMVCGLAAAVIPFYMDKWKIKFSIKYYVLLGFLLFSVICSGSRSAIVSCAICLIGTILHFNLKKLLLFLIPVILVPVIFPEMFDEIYGSIVHQGTYGGSSSDMRENQWLFCLSYIGKDTLFGTGLGRTWTIGYESDLLGAESILFYTIIDRGFWGLITIAFLYIYILFYLFKNKNFALCFVVIGFLVNKIVTLTAGLDETYPLLWLIPLLKEQMLEKNNK